MTSKQLKDLLNDKDVHPDAVHKVRATADSGELAGCFRVRRSYFYKHGQTPEDWAAKVMAALPTNWEQHDVVDDYNDWPKDSYFTVYVKQGANDATS